jgi:DNA-binding transcriptional regulator LsrR (DeoR family)
MEIGTDLQKLIQVAKMYYQKEMTQEKIAKQLSISRSAVSMMLSEAKNYGIVQIQIKDPYVNNEVLADELCKRFGLRKCIVVPTSVTQERLLLKIVASRAAKFASEIMFSHSSIGIAWGSTCYEFIQEFPQNTDLCDINVVPLIGGSPLVSTEFQLNESVRMYAEKLRGYPLFIYAPGIVDSLQDKKRFLESIYMKTITERWQNLDFAIVGVGQPPENYDDSYKRLSNDCLLEQINKYPEKVVGDLCARRFNIKGEILNCDYNNKLIGIDEKGMKSAKNVLGIATGNNKTFSIIGALNSKLLHYFVTDENTAKYVFEYLDSNTIKALS